MTNPCSHQWLSSRPTPHPPPIFQGIWSKYSPRSSPAPGMHMNLLLVSVRVMSAYCKENGYLNNSLDPTQKPVFLDEPLLSTFAERPISKYFQNLDNCFSYQGSAYNASYWNQRNVGSTDSPRSPAAARYWCWHGQKGNQWGYILP